MKKQIIFDTDSLLDHYDLSNEADLIDYNDDVEFGKENALAFLDDFVHRYEVRYHTKITKFILLGEHNSQYGYIGHNGAHCYREMDHLADIFNSSADKINIYIDENRKICIDYYDHDGTNYTKLKLLPVSFVERANRAWNEFGQDLIEQLGFSSKAIATAYFN